MPTDSLSPRRRQTLAARQALAAKFPDAESRSAYFTDLAKRAAALRVIPSADEADALRQAYALLSRVAKLHGSPLHHPAPSTGTPGVPGPDSARVTGN